ncbi:hypothetical protein EES37_37685 [Streptomyces sp. ADI91-18]|nr:hypothetical protein EES37_37685 [Streptomyces sp. ADI91-18]
MARSLPQRFGSGFVDEAQSRRRITCPEPAARPRCRKAKDCPSSKAAGRSSVIVTSPRWSGFKTSNSPVSVTSPATAAVPKWKWSRSPVRTSVPPCSSDKSVMSAAKRACPLIEPGAASTCPRSTAPTAAPRINRPTFMPALASSTYRREASISSTATSAVLPKPTISTASPLRTRPRSIRPASMTTLPWFCQKRSPICIRNGLPGASIWAPFPTTSDQRTAEVNSDHCPPCARSVLRPIGQALGLPSSGSTTSNRGFFLRARPRRTWSLRFVHDL